MVAPCGDPPGQETASPSGQADQFLRGFADPSSPVVLANLGALAVQSQAGRNQPPRSALKGAAGRRVHVSASTSGGPGRTWHPLCSYR